MSTHKSLGKKLRLGRAMKNNESVPVWVILRTNGKYKYNLMRRDWRRNDLKV
jgi:large subunit ribosomal protein L39e